MRALLLSLAAIGVAFAQASDWREGAGHLRLVDSLDRPEDGYCLDVLGSGPTIRFDLPLMAHNCKPGLYADEAVRLREDSASGGDIYFPAYDGCVTAAGVAGGALPHAALMLKACGESTPFLHAVPLQRFTLRKDGKVELIGQDLCLSVGAESDTTFSPEHRWRTLYLVACDEADSARAIWRFAIPESVNKK